MIDSKTRKPSIASILRLAGNLLACCAAALAAHAAEAAPVVSPTTVSSTLVVEAFGSERGLAVENVIAIYQDRTGFLWIGTRQGLIMYDGHSATTFAHDVSDPHSIPDNYVRTVFEDRDRNLWIGTNSTGLAKLDRATWTFQSYRHDSANPKSISHDSVNVIFQDRAGALWVGTQIGLNRFDPATGNFEQLLSDANNPASLSNDYVYALHEDIDGQMWVGTVGGGLDRLDRSTLSFTHRRSDPSDPTTLSSNKVFAIAEDQQGQLWIGTEQGLDRLDRQRSRFDHIAYEAIAPGQSRRSIVTTLVVDHDDVLWVGLWSGGGGLERLDTRTGNLLPAPTASSSPLLRERVAALRVDRSGAVWIGTWARGLVRARRAEVQASLLDTKDGLSFNDVTAVLEAPGGRLWAGTWGSGLNLAPIARMPFDPSARSRFGLPLNTAVLSLVQVSDEEMWVGTMDALYHLRLGGEAQEYAHDPNHPESIGPGYVTALLRDQDGVLWVGVGGSGLFRLRPGQSSFDRFANDPSDTASLSDNYITSLIEDRDGVLWVGTRSGGVNELDRATGRFIRHVPDPTDPNSLSFHHVTAMAVDQAGAVWISTSGGGLNVARRTGNRVRFERFTKHDGLIDDMIRSLALDNDVLWLATANGVTRFDIKSKSFTSFDTSDGLPTSGFNAGAASTGGEQLYFGSAKGLLAIPRGLPLASPAASPTVLRDVRTLQGTAVASSAPWDLDKLEVPYGEILSFAFAVLDYGDARRHRFAYRLAGLRDDWIDIGDRREVTFTELKPGKYTLDVRGRNSHGVWSNAATSLSLVVVPPFWMTLWFRAFSLAALALAVVAVHRQRTWRLKQRNRELVLLKDQREQALAESRASREDLETAYDRLRRLTRRLEGAKEDERKHIARELHDEMGQALTAAKINLQMIAALPVSSEASDRITDTVGLVDNMIRHVRALSLDLRPPLLDEFGLEPALSTYLEAQAQRSGLRIELTANGIPAELRPEVAITAFRFVQEAVTNVIRHAKASHVSVNVAVHTNRLDLSVRDDGNGFDVAQTLARAVGGQHLGLLGIRERVESLDGSLEIISSPNQSTSLSVSIPWR